MSEAIFVAASLASPALRFSQEFCSDPPTAEYRFHVPAFDEPNRMGRIATIGVRPQGNFDEPDQRIIMVLSYEHDRLPARSGATSSACRSRLSSGHIEGHIPASSPPESSKINTLYARIFAP